MNHNCAGSHNNIDHRAYCYIVKYLKAIYQTVILCSYYTTSSHGDILSDFWALNFILNCEKKNLNNKILDMIRPELGTKRLTCQDPPPYSLHILKYFRIHYKYL